MTSEADQRLLTPPYLAWSEVRAYIVRVWFYAQAWLIRHLNSAVFDQRPVVEDELFPGYRWVALIKAPSQFVRF
jgi:hypothetical protein